MTTLSPAEQEVRAANAAFYAAFVGGDMPAMAALWARHAPCACIHPGAAPLIGRETILASWRQLLADGSPTPRPGPHCAGEHVHMLGDTAFVTCFELFTLPGENGVPGRLAATNVFVREEGVWRMVHHQAGPAPIASMPRAATPPAQIH